MATINLGVDNGYGSTADNNIKNKVKELLEAKGHTVADAGRGPNETQSYSKKNKADIMIQIANGKCIGTLCDFHVGTGRYYLPKQAGIMYWKCWDPNWKIYRAKDDHFSDRAGIREEVEKWLGKTMPEAFQGYDDMFYGYGDNAEEMVNTFLNNWNGTGGDVTTSNGANDTNNQTARRKAKDMLFEALNRLSDYGIEVYVENNRLTVMKSNIDHFITIDSSRILAGSVTITPYQAHTPNVFIDKNGKKHRDEYLIKKNGEVELKVDEYTPLVQAIKQRDYDHKIDMKILADPNTTTGRWVKLNMPEFEIKNRMYYITKLSYVENSVYSITLEPAPPKREYETTSLVSGTGNNASGAINKGEICSIIEKVGGVPITDYKSLYENFKKFHYKLYYQDRKTLKEELNVIQNGGTCNCVDFAQLYMSAFKEAGFKEEIQIVNGWAHCNSNWGHVWCRVKDNGNWVTVDPSAAASHKYDIGKLICGYGSITQINPQMFVLDDGHN